MVSKKISLLEFENNSNIGLYMFVNDKFCLIGLDINDKKKKEIEEILNVPVYKLTALNTQLLGVFILGNNDLIIVPELLKNELSKLEVICSKHSVKIHVLKDKLNTLGNNIVVGNEEILINNEFNNNFIQNLKKLTNKNIITIKNNEFNSIGGLCRFIDNKYYVSQDLEEKDFKKILNKISGVGTINSGSSYIASGVIGNKFGILIGSNSSTIEIQSIVDAFD